MRRITTSTMLALVLATLGTAGAAAAGPKANPNAGEVELACENGTQVIWVNFLASDLSNGGGVPAIVVDGDAGRVYKVMSASVAGETFITRLPGNLPFDPVVCTHDSPYGLVTLTGVFIP
jgi:hypothetical protein